MSDVRSKAFQPPGAAAYPVASSRDASGSAVGDRLLDASHLGRIDAALLTIQRRPCTVDHARLVLSRAVTGDGGWAIPKEQANGCMATTEKQQLLRKELAVWRTMLPTISMVKLKCEEIFPSGRAGPLSDDRDEKFRGEEEPDVDAPRADAAVAMPQMPFVRPPEAPVVPPAQQDPEPEFKVVAPPKLATPAEWPVSVEFAVQAAPGAAAASPGFTDAIELAGLKAYLLSADKPGRYDARGLRDNVGDACPDRPGLGCRVYLYDRARTEVTLSFQGQDMGTSHLQQIRATPRLTPEVVAQLIKGGVLSEAAVQALPPALAQLARDAVSGGLPEPFDVQRCDRAGIVVFKEAGPQGGWAKVKLNGVELVSTRGDKVELTTADQTMRLGMLIAERLRTVAKPGWASGLGDPQMPLTLPAIGNFAESGQRIDTLLSFANQARRDSPDRPRK